MMKSLIAAYIALVLLLTTTVGFSFVHLGPVLGTCVGLLVAVAKTVVIVRVFMDFRQAGAIANVWFCVALGWLVLLSGTLLDYVARPWDAHPRSWIPTHEQPVIGTSPDAGAPTALEENRE